MSTTQAKTGSISKYALTVAGAILVGAIGSGLWEAVLHPALRQLSYWALDLAALGLQSYRGQIYREIAQDAPNTALDTFATVTLLWISCIYAAVSFAAYRMAELRFRLNRIRAELTEPEPNASEFEEAEAEFAKDLSLVTKEVGRTWLFVYVAIVVASIIITFHVVLLARNSYTTRAVMHYNQTLKIATPYLDPTRRAVIESEFSQIHDKEGYARVLGELTDVAHQHGQTVPEFRPW